MINKYCTTLIAGVILSTSCLVNLHASEPTTNASSGRETAKPSPDATETIGQRNARRSAALHLKAAPYSRQELIKQLVYEQYSLEDATYGVDIANTDWNIQAGRHAEAHLKAAPYSRQGLIKLLIYNKYSQSEAEYGVNKVGY